MANSNSRFRTTDPDMTRRGDHRSPGRSDMTTDPEAIAQGTVDRPPERTPAGDESSVVALPDDVPPWLLRQRVDLPDRVAGYLDRPGLVERAMPTQRRLTVLKAGGGFGKTVLLAECCRRLRTNGVAAAWLSLDASDAPDTLDTYIAVACANAGLIVGEAPDTGDGAGRVATRTAMVVQELQSLGTPFVIAFDELEELTDPVCVSLIDFLLRRGPSNLHLAFAGREVPPGLNVAGPALDGRAQILGTEDLRFARADVAAFFDFGLSRRALAREATASAGWPFALRVSRNTETTRTGSVGADDLSGNWIEARLLAPLRAQDRNLVLDLGLFGWMDEALLAEVLSGDALARVRSLGVLDGLLEPVQTRGARIWRLHALVRTYCAAQRLGEDAVRARSIHRRIAGALARRGEIVAGMRHAVASGDPALAGEIFERAGGVRLWVRHGVTQYREAIGLLPDAVVAGRPRLGLARCVHLTLSGHHHEARALYAECAPAREGTGTAGNERDRDVDTDDCIVRGAMWLYGGQSVAARAMRTVFEDGAELALLPELDAPTRGHLEYALSVLHFIRAEFDAALKRLAGARELLRGSRYIEFYSELLHAQVHFVRGQAQEAAGHFDRARRVARKHLLLDPVAMLSSEVARRELVLERDPAAAAEPGGIGKVLMDEGTPFSAFATALSMFVQARLVAGGADEVAAFARRMLVRVRAAGMPAYGRLLAAARVSALVLAGRIEDAERAWREASLPTATASCVDLDFLSLREVESVSEARARLLLATGRHAEARGLLRAYFSFAEERGLRRTQLRALALAVGLEQAAGDREASQRHVAQYVRLFAEAPYTLPMVLDRALCEAPVRRFLASGPDAADAGNARLLLGAMRSAGARADLSLTDRERAVLRLLPDNTVKSMAASLGLTVHGVRHHLRKLFAKLEVSSRRALLHRARELGLAPDRPEPG